MTYSYMKCPEKANKDTESRLVDAWSWVRQQGLIVNGHQGSYWGDGNVLKLDYGDGCTTQ